MTENPKESPHLQVVYRDDWILAVNKPPGLVCHPVGHYQGDTLLSRVQHYYGKEARLVHRLDQETSGIIVMARSLEVAQSLYVQFSRSLVGKKYLALVEGCPIPEEGEISLPISSCREESVIKIKMRIFFPGLESRTRYRVTRRVGPYCLLEVSPLSGRKHQIRLHLASAGHPIVGDPIYRENGLPFLWNYYLQRSYYKPGLFEGLGLHAYQVRFQHPITGDILALEAPLPETWQKWTGRDIF